MKTSGQIRQDDKIVELPVNYSWNGHVSWGGWRWNWGWGKIKQWRSLSLDLILGLMRRLLKDREQGDGTLENSLWQGTCGEKNRKHMKFDPRKLHRWLLQSGWKMMRVCFRSVREVKEQ